MRILVTGAAGFIGQWVWRQLEANGHELVGCDSMEPQVHGYETTVEVFVSDVLTRSGGRRRVPPDPRVSSLRVAQLTALRSRVPGPFDAVVHLAAKVGVGQSMYDPVGYTAMNVMDTAYLLEMLMRMPAAERPRKLVVASSMSIYGEGEYRLPSGSDNQFLFRVATGGLVRQPAEGLDCFTRVNQLGATERYDTLEPAPTRECKMPEPASVYAMTKYDQEVYSLLLGRAYGIPTVALRFFNTFGEGQALANPYTGALAIFCARVMNGERPIVYEDGYQQRDFIHVSDVANAVVTAVEQDDVSGVFNIGTGVATSVGVLAELACQVGHEAGYPLVTPDIVGRYRVGDVRHCYADPSAFQKATGWHATKAVSLGVRDVVAWMRTQPRPPAAGVPGAQSELAEWGLLRGPAT